MTTQKCRKLLLAVALVSAGLILPSILNETEARAGTPVIDSGERTDTGPASRPTSAVGTETANQTTTVENHATTVENHTTTVTATSESNLHHLSFGDVRATVFLNCTYFWITVTPADAEYSLVLTYLDPETDQRFRVPTGSLIGKSSDPFGQNGLLLLEVEVRVPRRPSVAVHLPDHCLEGNSNETDSLGSSYGFE